MGGFLYGEIPRDWVVVRSNPGCIDENIMNGNQIQLLQSYTLALKKLDKVQVA